MSNNDKPKVDKAALEEIIKDKDKAVKTSQIVKK